MPIDVPQNEKVGMGMLKECVLDVVKKSIMLIAVQQSIRRPGPVMLDYIASSVEKTDILPVGVPIAPHSVRHHQMAPLPGRMIRIFQPDKDAINPQCSILMPPRVAKILKQDKHASTKQRMPKDIWEDQNFMGGLISSLYSEVKACL